METVKGGSVVGVRVMVIFLDNHNFRRRRSREGERDRHRSDVPSCVRAYVSVTGIDHDNRLPSRVNSWPLEGKTL